MLIEFIIQVRKMKINLILIVVFTIKHYTTSCGGGRGCLNPGSTLYRVPALVQRIQLHCTYTNPRIVFSQITDILYRLTGNQQSPIAAVVKVGIGKW